MYNFFKVSGHNLESSQTCGFCTDFLNHREGGVVFLLSTLQYKVTHYRNCKRLPEFEEIKAVEVNLNRKVENS
jgi:hypothetical protein